MSSLFEKYSLFTEYELWTTGSSAFDWDTVDKFYVATTATDSNGESSSPLSVEVNVVPNEQVTINNVEGLISKYCISFIKFNLILT